MTVESLRDIYGVRTDKELGVIFDRGEKAVSAWRRNGIPSAVLLAAEQKQRADAEKSGYLTEKHHNRPDGAFDIPPSTSQVPIISWAQAGEHGYFEDAYPPGAGFGYVNRPYDVSDPHAYSLIISGDSMTPKFEPGDLIIVSPGAVVQTGDYAVVKLQGGQVMAKKVKEKNSHYVLQSINPEYQEITCGKEDVMFLHRIVWVKQRG